MVKGKSRTFVRRQATKARRSPLLCPRCRSQLSDRSGVLRCPEGHAIGQLSTGVVDLWPAGRPLPAVDTYSSPLGWAYDHGVNNRALARLTARLEWGTDVRRMYDLMDAGVRCSENEVVLDVPVGGGTTFAQGAPELRGQLIGIDLSRGMLRRAARRRGLHGLTDRVILARGDATELPLASASVDRVLCFNGLHVIPAKEAALGEFRRVLRPGAELVGTALVEDGTPPFSAVVAIERMAAFFVPANAGALPRLAKEAGFSSWEQHTEGSYLYFRGK